MLLAAFVPSAPVLVPGLTGGALPELAGLTGAVARVVDRLVAAGPERVWILGSDAVEAPYDGSSLTGPPVAAALARYGGPGARPGVPGGLPLPLAVGGWLLDRAGYGGARSGYAAPPDSVTARLTSDPDDVLLVVGDGSARRDDEAPGTFDAGAAPFDDRVAEALRAGDAAALAALDPAATGRLLAAGVGAWRLAGRTLVGRVATADLAHHSAPFGVAYLVASWSFR